MEKPSKLPRQIRSQQVKQQIIESTEKLIERYGYEQVTVDGICEDAKVCVGSFYHHFKNKGELLAYYFADGYEKYWQGYRDKLGEDFIENIIMICNTYTRFCMKQGVCFIKNFYTPSNKCLEISDAKLESGTGLPIGQKVYKELKQAQVKGHLVQDTDISQVVIDMCVIEKGLMFEWCLTNGRYELLENSQRILRNLLNDIASEKYKRRYGENEKYEKD